MGSISSTWATQPFTLCTWSGRIGRTASTWPPEKRPPPAACCSNAPWPETCTSWRSISRSPASGAWPRARRAVGNGRRAGKGIPRKSMKLAVLLLIAPLAASAADALAPTPPMGWNSWDSYGTTVTEAEVKANADYMAARLKSHGWQYVVVDIQWSEPHPQTHGYRPNADLVMDENGRLTPATHRFPSAAGGKGFRARDPAPSGARGPAGLREQGARRRHRRPQVRVPLEHRHVRRRHEQAGGTGLLRFHLAALRGMGRGLHQGRRHFDPLSRR